MIRCAWPICYPVLYPKRRKTGVRLQSPIHAHFMYDRGIPLWAGPFMGWLYSRLGGTPILRGKVDRMGLRSARNLFANGVFPIAAAPEGATNGHTEIVSPLEPGISQLGFWCVEDLKKRNGLKRSSSFLSAFSTAISHRPGKNWLTC